MWTTARARRDTVARGDTGPLLAVFAAWRTRRALADPLRELGVPLLDLLRWCLPDAGAIVRAQATRASLFGPDRAAALLILRTAGGLVCTVDLAAALPPAHEQEDEVLIEILGEEAALRAEPYNQAITVSAPGERRRTPWHRDAMYPLLDACVGALRAGREPPGAPAEARPALALIEELRGAWRVARGAWSEGRRANDEAHGEAPIAGAPSWQRPGNRWRPSLHAPRATPRVSAGAARSSSVRARPSRGPGPPPGRSRPPRRAGAGAR